MSGRTVKVCCTLCSRGGAMHKIVYLPFFSTLDPLLLCYSSNDILILSNGLTNLINENSQFNAKRFLLTERIQIPYTSSKVVFTQNRLKLKLLYFKS